MISDCLCSVELNSDLFKSIRMPSEFSRLLPCSDFGGYVCYYYTSFFKPNLLSFGRIRRDINEQSGQRVEIIIRIQKLVKSSEEIDSQIVKRLPIQ